VSAKRTVLLGKGSLGIHAAEWLHAADGFELVLVVPVIPEPTWTDSLAGWARDAGVPVVESGHFRDVPGHVEIDVALSVFYDRIIDAAFIERCGRIINLHNAPLPRYRGVSPINWALKNGERHHGVTIHEITPGIDDGPIVAQTTYSIFPDIDEVRDVYARSLAYGATLLEQTLPMLDRIAPVPQDESAATYYSKGDDERLGDRRGFTRD
jgi:methionyl-tRNA formyltransferase